MLLCGFHNAFIRICSADRADNAVLSHDPSDSLNVVNNIKSEEVIALLLTDFTKGFLDNCFLSASENSFLLILVPPIPFLQCTQKDPVE